MRKKPIYKTAAGEQALAALYDRILSDWPWSTESLRIDTRHGRTHVLAQGPKDAQPLVLLHGAGSNALAWGGDIPELMRHFRVYAVDTPGEPGRSCQERIPWKGGGIVEWLDDVLDGVGAGQVLLAGISQGGYIALRFASARVQRVKALVLLAPGGVSPVRPGFLARGIAYSVLGHRSGDAMVRRVTGDSELPAVAKEYMGLIYAHFRSRMDAQPLLSDVALRELTMPLLVFAGGRDAIFDSNRTAARFGRLVDGADVRLLPEAGHALINLAPDMMPFLTQANGRP